MKVGGSGDVLVVVKDEEGWRFQSAVQRFKKPPREDGQTGQVFWCEMRKRLLISWRRLCTGEAEIMKERRQIRIPRIELIPERFEFAGVEVTGDERRLPHPRRAGDPENGALLSRLIQPFIQPRALDDFGQTRRREFGQCVGCVGFMDWCSISSFPRLRPEGFSAQATCVIGNPGSLFFFHA